MNNTDRKRLNRIDHILSIPPYCAGGTQSTTIEGVAKYAQDFRYAIPKIRNILKSIACGELWEGEIEEEIAELEEWFEKRKSEDWQ